MAVVYDEACEHLGIDTRRVTSIAHRLDQIGKEMDELGIHLFGGSGSGSLRARATPGEGRDAPYVLAEITRGNFDGGDGSNFQDGAGYWRGKGA